MTRRTVTIFVSHIGSAEFVPARNQNLLVYLSIWWAFGQLVGSLVSRSLEQPVTLPHQFMQIAWPLMAKFSCPTTIPEGPCPRSSNMGWRYFLFTMGGLMLLFFFVRFWVFDFDESPKYLMGRGKDAEAVEIVLKVAAYNKKESLLHQQDLQEDLERDLQNVENNVVWGDLPKRQRNTTAMAAARRKLRILSFDHVRALFATREMAWSTFLLMVIWGQISL